jgi:cell division initiation protein
MSITPLDIQQKRFRTDWRGFEKAEVDGFLNLVASEVECLSRELHDLREDHNRQNRMLEEYRSREQAIKETMVTAQKVTEEITENAKKEAQIILGQAELESERLMESAQERLSDLLNDISDLKRQRSQFLSQLKGLIDTHNKLIEISEEEEAQPKVESNIAVMRRPQTSNRGDAEDAGDGADSAERARSSKG